MGSNQTQLDFASSLNVVVVGIFFSSPLAGFCGAKQGPWAAIADGSVLELTALQVAALTCEEDKTGPGQDEVSLVHPYISTFGPCSP